MSAGRFFVPPAALADLARVVVPAEVAGQVRSVLRLAPGDTITLLDGSGAAYALELTEVARDRVVGRVTLTTQPPTEPRTHLTLCVGLLKAAKFEWIVQKGTELGVSAFVPLLCARSVAESVSDAKLARWRVIATEAAEQSDRARVPQIHAPVSFGAALGSAGVGLIATVWPHPPAPSPSSAAAADGEGESVATIRGALREASDAEVHLFIGPEGGFTAAEVASAVAAGVRAVTLGPRILRAETAAIVAAALALDALGEMEGPPFSGE